MAHTIGRTIADGRPLGPGEHLFDHRLGATARFVILHFTELSLSGSDRLVVNLGYSIDEFDPTSGPDVWTRPIDPRRGPISISLRGSASATLREYVVGERTEGTTEPSRPNVSHADFFLHTTDEGDHRYDEPDYETTFLCGGGDFSWSNLRCALPDPIVRETADAVCVIVLMHRHPLSSEILASSCTGTLIGPDRVLTAHHCFLEPDGIDWKSASVCFNYETECPGTLPDSYSPIFYKVTGVVGRSIREDTPGEWIVLQIDTPPEGLGILPREFRETPVMALESVFAIHHPHGSPKKFERGTTTDLAPGFDFAGGSSGSALFDSLGKVIGGPLSNGGGCFATYTSATTVRRDLATPASPPRPLDVVLVMDRSGSMRQATPPLDRTKLDEAKSAAAMFVQLVRLGAGDRLGLVSYSNTAASDVDPEEVTDDHKEHLVGAGRVPEGAVGDLMAGGSTSIGGGLLKAIESIGTSSGNAPAILLLTDGLHNTPPGVEEVALGDAKLCIIGFGHDHELDGSFLRRLAGSHNGFYTRAADGLALNKFFGLCFGNIFEAGALADPDKILNANQEQADLENFTACGEEAVTLIVGWDDPREDLEALIYTPSGVVLDTSHPNVQSAKGDKWWFMRVPLPIGTEREGTWKFRVRRPPFEGEFPPPRPRLRYFTLIIAKGGPVLQPLPLRRRVYTGDPFEIAVGLFNKDGTAPHGNVNVVIEAPNASLGAIAASHGRATPIIDGDPVDAFRANLRRILGTGQPPVPIRTITMQLLDDGSQLDGSFTRDGIYTRSLPDLTRFEGTYTFHAQASYPCGKFRGTRETVWSIYVEPGIDPSMSEVLIEGVRTNPDGINRGTIRVYPRDQYGNPVGPGRSHYVNLVPPINATVVRPTRDAGDGTYTIDIAWPAAERLPGIFVAQPERPPLLLPFPPGAVQEPCDPDEGPCHESAKKLLDCLGLGNRAVTDVQLKSVCLQVDINDCKTPSRKSSKKCK